VNDEILWRILIAAALGAVVGLEREAAGQQAGLRTHVSVAIGASLFGVVSTLGFHEFVAVRDTTNVQIDVTRVASQVVVGIGFIGAGLIFRQRGQVHNLTTAASLWVVSAIGLATGVGNPGAAGITTAALVGALVLLRPVRSAVERHLVRHQRTLMIRLAPQHEPDEVMAALSAEKGVNVRSMTFGKEDGAATIRAMLTYDPGLDGSELMARLAGRDDVDTLIDEAEL
jgi:putative Mg2+ transporter-C (MgtC) family protein